MVSSEHLLRALIPHAVINHDVTAHLGRKGWVEPVSWTGSDAPPRSVAAARPRTCVSIMPWANSRDSFTRARLAALESLLRAEENRSALLAVTTLRTALADGLDDVAAIAGAVCVDSDESPGCAQEVVEAAMAWLRASPARCCLDLPCFNANRVHIQQTLSWEPRIIAALAPCVTHVHFGDSVAADAALKTLRQLPHATKVSMPVTFGETFMKVLDHRVAENDEAAVVVARGLRFVHFPSRVARVPNPRAAEPLFPNVTSLTLGYDIDTPDVWRWVSLHRALEDLKVDHMSFGLFDPHGEYAPSPAAAAGLEGAIVATFAQIGRSLRKLSLTVTDYVNVTAPRILASICEHCLNVCELTLQHVGARPGFFRDLAGLRHLQSLTLEDVDASGEAEEAADLVALPAALVHLEEFTQRDWELDIPRALVEALAAHPRLTTWDAGSSFARRSASASASTSASVGPIPFRSLRVARMRAHGPVAAIALAPNLRLLVITSLDDCDALTGTTFASPHTCVVTRRSTAPSTLLAARSLHSSGVFALCGVLALDSTFEAAGNPTVELLPPTLRHAEFASPPHFRRTTDPCAKELTQLLTAARDSNLESLTLLHPPEIDVTTAFSSGGFRRLRSLMVLGASKAWTDALPVLQSACPEVVVDCECHPRINSANPWYNNFA